MMLYRNFQDLRLSALGFGMMRLPGEQFGANVRETEVADMIDYAISHGVNYFDTAWDYHAGSSELVAGNISPATRARAGISRRNFPATTLQTSAG